MLKEGIVIEMFKSPLIFCYLICIIGLIHTSTYTDLNQLYDSLTNGHNPNLRPQQCQTDTTNISVEFLLISLLGINAVAGTVSITGVFLITWNDASVVWNPASFGGIKKAILPASAVWKPPLMVLNSAKSFKTLGIEGLYVRILNNGNVFWEPGESITFSCSIDITYFPFDTQKCQFSLVVLGYEESEIRLFNPDAELDENYFQENGEWELIYMDVRHDSVGLNFVMHFKRRPLFLIISIILPVMFIAFLDIFVFVLPQESGERVGFSITALLSLVVFLTIAQELLPAMALPRLSVLCVHLISDMFMSGCITLSVIISSWIYHRTCEKSIPILIQKLIKVQLFKRTISPSAVSNTGSKVTNGNDECNEEDRQLTWQDVATFWDVLSIAFYIFWFLVALLVFIIDINLDK